MARQIFILTILLVLSKKDAVDRMNRIDWIHRGKGSRQDEHD
jgi:hypothetical protein